MDNLGLISRKQPLFIEDLLKYDKELSCLVANANFLVIGGAGSIGQSVCKQIFQRQPKKLHVVDISENNLVELVRDLRSSIGYIDGEFKTYAIDVSSLEFKAFFLTQNYDYILNLSALKHVRSEKDVFTLMRMINTNIINVVDSVRLSKEKNIKKYFCVSSDKAANPANLMGATKKIMEMFLNYESKDVCISSARFANVAFSDGSLLYGLNQRLLKKQPISAPLDIKRYFISSKEAGELCLMSCVLGNNNDIFFPKESKQLQLTDFKTIISNYLALKGFELFLCGSEEEARRKSEDLIKKQKWPCYFFETDTSGEKPFEEFYTKNETIFLKKFTDIGIVKNKISYVIQDLDLFYKEIITMRKKLDWSKLKIINEVTKLLPNFIHDELEKNLDQRM